MNFKSDSPFSCLVDADERLAYIRMWGVVTGDDLLKAVESVHGDAAWSPGFDLIWDCSAVRSHDIVPSQVAPIVLEEVSSGDGRDAVVSNSSLGDRAVKEMLAAFCRRRGKEVVVYSSLEEALASIGRESLPASFSEVTTDASTR